MKSPRSWSFVLPASVLAVVAAAVITAVNAAAGPGEGPFDLVWDKMACSACGMHVGEPPFAAQMTTTTGRRHGFDDPGCLFQFIAAERPDVHSVFFRDHRSERWLALADAAFVTVAQSPMGFGLAAVPNGTSGAITVDEARRRCLSPGTGGR